MKKLLLFAVFLSFVLPTFSQVLKEPTLERFGTARDGKILIVNQFKEIWESEISIKDINNIEKKQEKNSENIENHKRELLEIKKNISNKEKLINEQKREIDDLKKTINQLIKQIDNLERKIK